MCFVNETVVTTACVTELCQQIENRLTVDDKFVECLCHTNWKTLSKRASNFQRELNKDTKRQLKWMDRLIEARRGRQAR